jgi:hypothetical protein
MLQVQAVEELPASVKLVEKRLLGTMSIRTLQNIIQKLFFIPKVVSCANKSARLGDSARNR